MGNGAMPHGPSYRAHPRLYHSMFFEFQRALGAGAACKNSGNRSRSFSNGLEPIISDVRSSAWRSRSSSKRRAFSIAEQRHRAVLAEIREASRIFRARNNIERKFQAGDLQPRDLIATWSFAFIPPYGES